MVQQRDDWQQNEDDVFSGTDAWYKSICATAVMISQKRCKLGSPNLHHRLPGRL